MSRSKIAVAVALIAGSLVWSILRTGTTAGAAEAEPACSECYGENTEDVALHRWQHNAPRHWRSLMVKR